MKRFLPLIARLNLEDARIKLQENKNMVYKVTARRFDSSGKEVVDIIPTKVEDVDVAFSQNMFYSNKDGGYPIMVPFRLAGDDD